MTVSQRSGADRRNAPTTPAVILRAALRAFAEDDYHAVGVRRIAALAGVDAALINRYFGSKEQLFQTVVQEYAPQYSMWSLVTPDTAQLGLRLVNHLLFPPSLESSHYILVVLRNSGQSAPAIIGEMRQKFVHNMESVLPGPDAYLRAKLIDTILVGIATTTLLHSKVPIRAEYQEPFAHEIARLIQHYLDLPATSQE